EWMVRATALGVLAGMGESRAALEAALREDPDEFVRRNAAEALAGMEESRAALEAALREDPEDSVRDAAEGAGAGSREGVAILVGLLIRGEKRNLFCLPFPNPVAAIWPNLDSYTLLENPRLVGDLTKTPLGGPQA